AAARRAGADWHRQAPSPTPRPAPGRRRGPSPTRPGAPAARSSRPQPRLESPETGSRPAGSPKPDRRAARIRPPVRAWSPAALIRERDSPWAADRMLEAARPFDKTPVALLARSISPRLGLSTHAALRGPEVVQQWRPCLGPGPGPPCDTAASGLPA